MNQEDEEFERIEQEIKRKQDAAMAQGQGRDWSLLEATQESLREHMAEIKRLKALLEQPEPVQEPSYWLGYGLQAHTEKPFEGATPLYTTPPIVATPLAQPAAWVGLTDEQANLLINGRGDKGDDDYVEPTGDGYGLTDEDLVKLIRRVEAHHGIGVKL
jgi:hypothetical protein